MTHKVFLNVLMVIVLAFGFVPIVHADSPSPTEVPTGPHSAIDPNYRPTQEELDRLATKTNAAKEYANGITSSVTPMLMYLSNSVYVGYAEQFRELEDPAYVNYCGPSSTQVTMRARTTSIPSLEEIAVKEKFDNGVWMVDVTPALNYFLGTTWYVTGYASGPTQLEQWYGLDTDSGYAMMTGVTTGGMPGWGSYNVYHIVTIYGYDLTVGHEVRFVDTSSEMAGHHYANGGAYFNLANLSTFWLWVYPDNVQSW